VKRVLLPSAPVEAVPTSRSIRDTPIDFDETFIRSVIEDRNLEKSALAAPLRPDDSRYRPFDAKLKFRPTGHPRPVASPMIGRHATVGHASGEFGRKRQQLPKAEDATLRRD